MKYPLACLLFLPLVADALIIRDDVPDANYRDLAMNDGYPAGEDYPDFSPVGALYTPSTDDWGSAVMITSQWALTAAHVLREQKSDVVDVTKIQLNFGADLRNPTASYQISAAYLHPAWTAALDNDAPLQQVFGAGVDIALVKLTSPVTGMTPASYNEVTTSLGEPMYFSGYGDFGNGLTGPTTDDGLKRAGQNVVDRVLVNLTNTFAPEYQGSLLAFDFDNPQGTSNSLDGIPNPPVGPIVGNGTSDPTATPLEADSSSGDSGGPLFIFDEDDGEWLVAGISSFGNMEHEVYGDVAMYTGVAQHQDWIDSVIPEPRTLPAILGILTLLVVFIRRRRSHR